MRDFPPIHPWQGPRIHPGEILKEEFLDPMNITAYRLAKSIDVPQIRVSQIIRGKRAISADTALRLGRFFGMEAQFWLNLQTRYDLEVAQEALVDTLKHKVIPYVPVEIVPSR